MAVLNSYQKLSRVLTGKPFGSGADGDLTVSASASQALTAQSCTGTATQSTLTIASGLFTNGDVIIIHQTRGTGAGQWEINQVISGGGTTTLTLKAALQFTYTDSGASQAQVVRIPQYNNVVINSSQTLTGQSWNGNLGGILTFACKNLTVSGTLAINGGVGGTKHSDGSAVGGAVGGFRGGNSLNANPTITAYTGEGSANATLQQTGANGSGGGGGQVSSGGSHAGGGGGGNANAGTSGTKYNSAVAGVGGSATGSADLITFLPGGGGGGAAEEDTTFTIGAGGSAGGMIAIFAKNIISINSITANGGNGGNGSGNGGGGGGGAGGSVLLVSQTATLGTTKVAATQGTGGTSGQGAGGSGSVGRIALHYADSYSGTTNPALVATQDTTLVERHPAFLFNMIGWKNN